MTPVDVMFGIQALVRLGKAGEAAFEQAVRDRDIALPVPAIPNPTPFGFAKFVMTSPDQRPRFAVGGDLVGLVHTVGGIDFREDSDSQAKLVSAANAVTAAKLQAEPGLNGARNVAQPVQAAGYFVVKQWVQGTAPPSPLARVGLALAAVALDYAATKPALFGAGAGGDKLIAAVALNLGELLPDPDDPTDWRTSFAERTTAIVFQATLTALDDNAESVVSDAALRGLVKGVIKPVVTLAAANEGQLPRWTDLRETLLGGVANAAAQAVLDNQAAWLGHDFAPEEAMGAIVQVLFEQAAAPGGLRSMLGDAGLMALYRNILGAIGKNPALVLGSNDSPDQQLLRDLLSGLAEALADVPKPLGKIDTAALLGDALTAFERYVPARLPGNDPWTQLAVKTLTTTLEGVVAGATDPAAPPPFSPTSMQALLKLFWEQAAATPEMIVGTNPELGRVATALFGVVGKKGASLMSEATWLDLAATALRQVSLNPGALVGASETDPAHQLGFDYLGKLLDVAAGAMETQGRRGGALLFGDTLAAAAKRLLEATAKDAAKLAQVPVQKAYEQLLARLTALTASQPGGLGAAGWLALFSTLLPGVLREGTLPPMTDAELIALLRKGES